MALFQQSIQKKFIEGLDNAKVEAAYQKLMAHFGNIDVPENIRNAEGGQYQEGFLREFFVDVLGYPNEISNEVFNGLSNEVFNGLKPIGIDIQFIEIQAFNHNNNQSKCTYSIISNFRKLRFYIENTMDFEEFDLFDLSKERFDLLYLCLHADHVLSDLPLRIKQASLEITKHIIDTTVGERCKQKKRSLGLDNESLIKADPKKDGKIYRAKIDEYRNWLLQITILDPACGSGALLNQAFDFLLQEHRLIDRMTAMLLGDQLVVTDHGTEILENNIYGLDINEENVEMARRSLWLRAAKVGSALDDLSHLNDLSRNIKCETSLINIPPVASDYWQKVFPQVFRPKDKEGFHIVLTTHNSRTSQRMIRYHVVKGEALEFDLEKEIILTEIIRDIVLEKNYNCIAYNICKDHVHLVLACEHRELGQIVQTIKGKSAYLYNRHPSNNRPSTGDDPSTGNDPSTGFQPGVIEYNGLKPVGNIPPVGDTPPVGNTPPSEIHKGHVWSQKFFRAFLDVWELAELSHKPGWVYKDSYLTNAIRYVKNNRQKHNLPFSQDLNEIIDSFCVPSEWAFRVEITGGFDVVMENPPT